MTIEEAIKILKEIEYPVNGDNKEYRDTAFDMAIKALEQRPKWIPCAERLPETNDIYLVSMHSYGLPTRDIDGYIQQTDKKWEVYGNKVIAWMPLPEPYKAESEDEG